MPVSRGRKPKKNKKQAKAQKTSALEPAALPAWMPESIENVLDGASVLLKSESPRELDQATASLLGGELHRALLGENDGLDFDLFFEAVVLAATNADPRQELWLLLQGMSAISPPGFESFVRAGVSTLRKALRSEILPDWPQLTSKNKATGDVWEIQDVYGTRLGVLAAFAYPGGVAPTVYLFEIDTSWIPRLDGGGVYDSLDQAVEAWRQRFGEQAAPVAVTDPRRLEGLVSRSLDLLGDESRTTLDNWYRAERRYLDLDTAMKNRGLRLPPGSYYVDVDPAVMTGPFNAWHLETFGNEPDDLVVEDLAAEWMEGIVPATWFAVSPDRLDHLGALIGDWPDDTVRPAAQALLPKWVRWLGDRADLPSPLVEAMVAKATK
ncbi:hypothetical protein [Amycolatopsis azurea]|uniref:Uncharacterized protein n=1 Tax=Amycolatopsis azurea DSM 43854 TaxID=1238180 RepID=M2PZH9_9PSEU|nr:hypothetical protein [Amycolatopsis azurea]EMD30048.1 hypothetical protein C791_0033 [Amycolatopsis azurea DSM 43854]OOC07254.1 hypothetical protein B0293_09445 [Amycolatopsis azurea DSM 43854]